MGAFIYLINTPDAWAPIVCWAYPWGPGALVVITGPQGLGSNLREFVWETHVILAQAREEGGPKRPTAGGGSTELAALKRYAGRHSMRPPVCGSTAVRFFAKATLSPQTCRKKKFLATLQARESLFF